ncbi:MAG: DNA-3-methyladenine glycosylase 2 family protein [Gemmatimonadetes bacterium]|nr:DNA-3-methyladenine glycosylase 2 family protein [Gemmatimonadota bacterium]
MKQPNSARQAVAYLKRADPLFGEVIRRVGPCPWTGRSDHTHFGYVLRSVVYQQLSGKAAATIFGRVQALYGGKSPTPEQLAGTPIPKLRAAGLSGRKAEYAHDLAERVRSGEILLDAFDSISDDEVLANLVRVRGIGRWTGQMVLMFHLARPDVFPELDLGVQKALQRLLRLRKLPSPERTATLGKRWAPYRTVAAWYLWRSLELPE